MHDTLQYGTVRRCQHFVEYVHPPSNICFSFRTIYNSRNRIVLLLFFWCQPTRSAHYPLKSGNTLYTIVDDNVEEAPIYRCEGKAPKPTRPHENHGLAIKHLPTWLESHQKPHLKSFAVPAQGSLVKSSKIQGMQECT